MMYLCHLCMYHVQINSNSADRMRIIEFDNNGTNSNGADRMRIIEFDNNGTNSNGADRMRIIEFDNNGTNSHLLSGILYFGNTC